VAIATLAFSQPTNGVCRRAWFTAHITPIPTFWSEAKRLATSCLAQTDAGANVLDLRTEAITKSYTASLRVGLAWDLLAVQCKTELKNWKKTSVHFKMRKSNCESMQRRWCQTICFEKNFSNGQLQVFKKVIDAWWVLGRQEMMDWHSLNESNCVNLKKMDWNDADDQVNAADGLCAV